MYQDIFSRMSTNFVKLVIESSWYDHYMQNGPNWSLCMGRVPNSGAPPPPSRGSLPRPGCAASVRRLCSRVFGRQCRKLSHAP